MTETSSLTCTFCPSEHRSLWWFHHVQGLRTSAAERPEESGGRPVEAERGAEWGSDKGRTGAVSAGGGCLLQL